MCFTLIGRLHTRLATLAGPLLLSCMFVLFTGERDYFVLFGLMAWVGIALELGVYGWLIGFQPRWLTLLLAIPEFLLVKWIMEWPYPFELRLHTRQALELYLVAWILGWLTLQIILPLAWPRWIEDGGEFRLLRSKRYLLRPRFLGDLTQRRLLYHHSHSQRC